MVRIGAVIHPPAPHIAPIPAGTNRPLLSVMIPVFNGASYLRETLRSVLSQDQGVGEMEIEVLDNCSTEDDPEAVVRELARPGRVGFHRHERNIGAIPNFNECVRRAKGEWVHVLHADDVVQPGFYAAVRRAIAENSQIDAVACRVLFIDELGAWIGMSALEARERGVLDAGFVGRQLREQRIQFVGMVVRRSAYEELGGFRTELRHCTDWDMWNRVAIYKKIHYEPGFLACYRVHSGNDSAKQLRTGANVVDERRAIRMAAAYVAWPQGKEIYRSAMREAALRAFRRVVRQWRRGERAVAWRQFREGCRCLVATLAV